VELFNIHSTKIILLLLSNVANTVSGNILSRVQKETYQKYWGKYQRINLKWQKSASRKTGKILEISGEIGYICNIASEVGAQIFNT